MSPVPNKPPKQEPVPRVDSKSTRGEEKIQDLQDPLDDNLSRLAKKALGEMMDGNESDLQSSEIAQILRSIGEDYGFDPETCAEIAALPFEEAFQDAYGYLVQAGIDAGEILSQYIQQTNYK